MCNETRFCIMIIGDYQLISPGQNGRYFADNIFKCICLNEKVQILIKILQKFVPEGPIDNNPALV